MKKKILFCLISFLSLHTLSSEEGAFIPLPEQNEKLEFSEDMNLYFQEELSFPEKAEPKSKMDLMLKDKVRIETSYLENGSLRLSFFFPKKVTYSESVHGDALYIVCNQPIDSPDLAIAAEQTSYLIKTVSNGWNTLYLSPLRPVSYSVLSEDSLLVIDIFPIEGAQVPATASLELAKARLLIEERSYSEAECALDALGKIYPQDLNVPILRAGLEGLRGNPQKQIWMLKELHIQSPWNEDVRTLYYDAYTPYSSFVSLEGQLQRTINYATIGLLPITVEAIASQTADYTLYIGAQYQFWRGKLNSIVNSEGVAVSFLGDRNQGNIYVRNEWSQGAYLKGIAYAQETAVFGGGVEIGKLIPLIQGDCIITLDYHRPCWEVFEAFAYHGRENRGYIQFNSTINRYVDISIGSGGRRVGITDVPNGYTSILLNAQCFLYCTVSNPSIALNYGIDAEYVRHEDVKIGSDGIPFNPVPLTSFEDHSLRAYLFYNWRNRLYLTCFAGETFNRLGTNDSTFGIDLKYLRPCPYGLELELSAYKFPSITVQGAQAIYVTATLAIRF